MQQLPNDLLHLICSFVDPIKSLLQVSKRLWQAYVNCIAKTCTKQQRDVLEKIILSSQHQLILGEWGTGKTYLLHLCQTICTTLNIPFKTFAFTGLAAKHARGETLHKGFPLTSNPELIGFKTHYQRYKGILFVDECSMISKHMMDQLFHLQPRDCKFVFWGDFLQLPPISSQEYMFESKHQEKLEILELTECKRQNDPEFVDAIRSLSRNKYTPQVLRFMISRQTAFTQLTTQQKDKCLYLFHDNARVTKRNEQCFQQLPGDTTVYPFWIQTFKKEATTQCKWFYRKKFTKIKHYHRYDDVIADFKVEEIKEMLDDYKICRNQFKIGCMIMFTRNVYDICGCNHDFVNWSSHHCKNHYYDVRNGTRAMVTDVDDRGIFIVLEPFTSGPVFFARESYRVPFGKTIYKQSLKIGTFVEFTKGPFNGKFAEIMNIDLNMYQMDFGKSKDVWVNVHDGWFEPCKRKIESYFEIEYFPCVLSYALTICKSEGMTLDQVVLHLKDVPTPNLVYVAISRCKTRDGLFINGPFTKPRSDLDPKLLQFYEDLKTKPKITTQTNSKKKEFYNWFHSMGPSITKKNGKYQVSFLGQSALVQKQHQCITYLLGKTTRYCLQHHPEFVMYCTRRHLQLYFK